MQHAAGKKNPFKLKCVFNIWLQSDSDSAMVVRARQTLSWYRKVVIFKAFF